MLRTARMLACLNLVTVLVEIGVFSARDEYCKRNGTALPWDAHSSSFCRIVSVIVIGEWANNTLALSILHTSGCPFIFIGERASPSTLLRGSGRA